MKRASELFGRWNPTPGSNSRLPNAARSVGGAPIGTIVVSVPGPPLDSEDFPAWLAAFCAAGKGKTCALFKELRLNRGAMYTWESQIKFCKETTAVFAIPTLTPTEQIAAAAREAIASITSVNDDRLQISKTIAIADYESLPEPASGCAPFSQGHDSPASKAFWRCFWQLYGTSAANDDKFLQKLKTVTPQDMRQIWSKFLPRMKVQRFLEEPGQAAGRQSTAE
jgi:predicted Zn-dependent peptidase